MKITALPERIEVWIPYIDIVLLPTPIGMDTTTAISRYIAQRLRDAGVPVRPSTIDVGLPAWTDLEYGQIVERDDDVRGGWLYVWNKNRLRYREEEKL